MLVKRQFCSVGSRYENLHQSPVMTSCLTYFIPRAHTGTFTGHWLEKKVERGFGRNEVKWTGKVRIEREKLLAVV